MVDVKEIQRILAELRFTKYESSIIIELYTRGPLKADELAHNTGVPLARIYDTLEVLKRKNFVSSSQGRPRIFSAINPQIAISTIIEQEKNKYEKVITKISSLGNSFLDQIQSMYLESHTQLTPDELLSQFSTLEEAEEFTIQLIQSAKKDILIFSHVFNWYNRVKNYLKLAIERGCSVRLLMQTDIDDVDVDPSFLKTMGIQVKTAPSKGIMTRGTLVDNKTVIFVIWASEGTHKGKPRRIYHPHYSTNQGIIEVFTAYFNYLWENA